MAIKDVCDRCGKENERYHDVYMENDWKDHRLIGVKREDKHPQSSEDILLCPDCSVEYQSYMKTVESVIVAMNRAWMNKA